MLNPPHSFPSAKSPASLSCATQAQTGVTQSWADTPSHRSIPLSRPPRPRLIRTHHRILDTVLETNAMVCSEPRITLVENQSRADTAARIVSAPTRLPVATPRIDCLPPALRAERQRVITQAELRSVSLSSMASSSVRDYPPNSTYSAPPPSASHNDVNKSQHLIAPSRFLHAHQAPH